MNFKPDSLSEQDLLNISSLINTPIDEICIEGELQNLTEIYSDRKFHARGGFKIIERATDNATKRTIALATLAEADKPVYREAFFREARILASLQHPNIVPLYSIGFIDQVTPCFSMKLIEGEDFDVFMNKNNKDSNLEVFVKVCDAVAYAHSKGIIHRDIKPQNVQVSSYGEVVVCDWGLARVEFAECEDQALNDIASDNFAMENMTLRGTIKGTPGYIAPEQITEGKSTHLSDIYALGAMLFKILYNKLPVDGKENSEILENTAAGKIRKIENDEHKSLNAVCMKAMTHKPEDRYSSVAELIQELRQFLSGFATQAENAGPLQQIKLLINRNKKIMALTGVFSLIILSLIIHYIATLSQREKEARALVLELQQERSEKIKIGEDALPTMMEKAEAAFLNNKLNSSASYIQTILKLDKNFIPAKNLNARLLFLKDDYDAVLLQMNSPEKNSDALIRQFCQSKRSHKDMTELIDQLYAGRDPESIIYLMHLLNIEDTGKRSLVIEKLSQWRHSRDAKHLLTVAKSLQSDGEKNFILKQILFLLENYATSGSSLIALQASKLCPPGEMKESFIQLSPANMALNQHVTATNSRRFPVKNAVDGNYISFWEGEPAPANIVIDLGVDRVFDKIILYFHFKDERYYRYRLSYSQNNRQFIQFIDRSQFTELTRAEPQTIRFPAIKSRFVKIEMISNSANPAVHMREMEIYYEEANKALGQYFSHNNVKLTQITDGINLSTGSNSWLYQNGDCVMDLGTELTVSKVRIKTIEQKLFSYQITGSVDGQVYQSLKKEASGEWTSFSPQQVRFLKFKDFKTADSRPLKISEIEVFEK